LTCLKKTEYTEIFSSVSVHLAWQMVGARGLEPLTSTVSKSERSVNPSKYGTSRVIRYQ